MTDDIKVLGNYHISNHDASRVVDAEGIAPTVKENHGTVTAIVDNKIKRNNMDVEIKTVKIRQATQQGYIECIVGGVFDGSYPTSKLRRGRVQGNGEICPSLTIGGSEQLYRYESKYRIRKLTPRECGRLMGVSDEDITKMLEVNSNSQCYKQFGNSICIPVMERMFEKIFCKESV